MSKHRITLAAAVLGMAILLSGCSDVNIYSEHREPDEFILIQAIGIDWDGGDTVVTASTGTGLDEEAPEVYEARGATLSEAINNIKYGYLKEEAFFSHTSQIVIGEEAARRGLGEYLDYTARNINMRLSANIYVVKGGTAGDLIRKADGGDISATDMLTAIEEKAEFMMLGKASTCESVIESLGDKGYALITAIEMTPPMKVSSDEEVGISPVGNALIRDGALSEYIDMYDSSGIGIVTGETKSGEITVNTETGFPVTLRMMELDTKLRASYRGDVVEEVTISLSLKFNVEGAFGNTDLKDPDTREEIEEKAAAEILRRATGALDSARAAGADFCGIGSRLNIRHPYKFRRSYLNWDDIFPEVVIKTEVSAVLARTYDIVNTPDMQGEENAIGTGK